MNFGCHEPNEVNHSHRPPVWQDILISSYVSFTTICRNASRFSSSPCHSYLLIAKSSYAALVAIWLMLYPPVLLVTPIKSQVILLEQIPILLDLVFSVIRRPSNSRYDAKYISTSAFRGSLELQCFFQKATLCAYTYDTPSLLFHLISSHSPYSCLCPILGRHNHNTSMIPKKARIIGCKTCTPFACASAPTANGRIAAPLPPNAAAKPMVLT